MADNIYEYKEVAMGEAPGAHPSFLSYNILAPSYALAKYFPESSAQLLQVRQETLLPHVCHKLNCRCEGGVAMYYPH